jgi:hypothetical protein
MKYSKSFRNAVLKKVLPPSNRSIYSVAKEAEKRWRRLKGFELLKLVIENKPFVNGVLVENAA